MNKIRSHLSLDADIDAVHIDVPVEVSCVVGDEIYLQPTYRADVVRLRKILDTYEKRDKKRSSDSSNDGSPPGIARHRS